MEAVIMFARWTTLSIPLCFFALLTITTGCGSSDPTEPISTISINGNETERSPTALRPQPHGNVPSPATVTINDLDQPPQYKPTRELHPHVVIKTSVGDITIRLDRENAPATVDNFLNGYVERGFYHGTVFHHVEDGFMIAGGGYDAELTEKPTRAPIRNEAENGLSNRRGTIAMIRNPEYPDSATSQFFINLSDNDFLDHQDSEKGDAFGYCVFGEVVSGIDIVDAIAKSEVAPTGQFPSCPVKHIVIEAIERTEL